MAFGLLALIFHPTFSLYNPNPYSVLYKVVMLARILPKIHVVHRKSRLTAAIALASLTSLFSIFYFLFSPTLTSAAGINEIINFQGKVANNNGTNVTDGTYDFVFKIYNGASSSATTLFTESWISAALFSSTMSAAPSSGGESLTYSSNTNESSLKVGQILWNTTKKESVKITSVDTGANTIGISATRQNWSTSDTVTNRIYVKDGLFTVSINSLNRNLSGVDFNSDSIYLGVEYNSDGEMKPRIQFASVPYAFNAQKVNGVTVTNTSGGTPTTGTTIKIADGKTVAFEGGLTFAGADGKTLTVNNTLTFGGTDGTSFTLPSTSGTLATSSATSGQLAFSTGTGILSGSSNLNWDNTNKWLGIGEGSPTGQLDVQSNDNSTTVIRVRNTANSGNTSAAAGLDILSSSSGGGLYAFADDHTTGRWQDRLVLKADSNSAGINLESTSSGQDIRFYAGSTTETMRLASDGTILLGNYQTAGGVLYTTSTGLLSQTGTGEYNQCLQADASGNPTWGNCVANVELSGGGSWTTQDATENAGWNTITYGNSKFVALNGDGTNKVMVSSNGTSWTPYNITSAANWRDVTYGGGQFVAVADFGTNRVATSADGTSWTSHSASAVSNWSDVAYGNGVYAAVSDFGTPSIMSSTNGTSWNSRTDPTSNNWTSITYGNGKFVAVSSTGTNRVITSTDGTTWVPQDQAADSAWSSVTYGNDMFVAVASSGTNRVMISPDGENWTAHSAAEANSWQSVTFGNGTFVAVASSGTHRVMTSIDGETWAPVTASEANSWYDIAFGNNTFAAVSGDGTHRVMISAILSRTEVNAVLFQSDISVTGKLTANGGLRVVNANGQTTAPTRTENGDFGFAYIASKGRLYVRINDADYYMNNDGTGDYSEYFKKTYPDEQLVPGMVIGTENGRVTKSVRTAIPLGVVSAYGTQGFNTTEGDRHTDTSYTNVGLLGQLPVIVSTQQGALAQGDYLGTDSLYPGVAAKHTDNDRAMLGWTSQSFNPNAAACQAISSIDQINWPHLDSNELPDTQQCFKLSDGTLVGKVMAYIRPASFGLTSPAETISDSAHLALQQLSTNAAGLTVTGNLTVAGDVSMAGGLRVAGPAEFKGPAIFRAIAEFFDKTIFHSDVSIAGQLALNKDTAGISSIEPGQTTAHITFDKPYTDTPITNANLVANQITAEQYQQLGQSGQCQATGSATIQDCQQQLEAQLLAAGIRYLITDRTTDGFTIKLDQPAPQKLFFSWTAFAQAN